MLDSVHDLEQLRAQRREREARQLTDRKASLPVSQAAAPAARDPVATLLASLADTKGRASTAALRAFWSELPCDGLMEAAQRVLGARLPDAIKVLWVGMAPLQDLDAKSLKVLAAALRASHHQWRDTACLGQALAHVYKKGREPLLKANALLNERLELLEILPQAKGLWRWVDPCLPALGRRRPRLV